jgi:hypothetical protein
LIANHPIRICVEGVDDLTRPTAKVVVQTKSGTSRFILLLSKMGLWAMSPEESVAPGFVHSGDGIGGDVDDLGFDTGGGRDCPHDAVPGRRLVRRDMEAFTNGARIGEQPREALGKIAGVGERPTSFSAEIGKRGPRHVGPAGVLAGRRRGGHDGRRHVLSDTT